MIFIEFFDYYYAMPALQKTVCIIQCQLMAHEVTHYNNTYRPSHCCRCQTTLDHESRSSYTLYVTAIDGDGSMASLTGMANVVIKVDDVNDNAPLIRVFSRPGGVPIAIGPRGGGGGEGPVGGGGAGDGDTAANLDQRLPAEVHARDVNEVAAVVYFST